jgi:hypothetical protein
MGFFQAIVPASIAAAVTIPALVALYFLKLRRRRVAVPSTLLWQKAIQDMQVNTPFQRLRRNLLLLLQLLILLALLLALAEPTLWASSKPGQRVVIVLDHSASMNAPTEPGGPTRLAEAKQAAHDVIDNLASGGDGGAARAMVVSYASQPQVRANFTGDPAKLRRAVDSVEPTDQLSHLGRALNLVEPYARQAAADQNSNLRVHVVTDGRVHREQASLPSLPGASLNFVQVAKSKQPNNLAIVACSARRSFETPERVQLFARVANFGPEPVEANLTLSVDGGTSRVQPVRVPAGGVRQTPAGPGAAAGSPAAGGLGSGSAQANQGGQASQATFQPGTESVQFDFALPGDALIELTHDHDDALPADDAARLALAPAKRLRALLVTPGNAFLQRVIESVGVRELVTMSPEKYGRQDPEMLRREGWAVTAAGPGSGFDVIIFDQHAPDKLPPVPTLSFGAVPPIENLSLNQPEGEGGQGQVILDWKRRHPTMRYVQLSEVVLADRGWLALPQGATVLATAQRGPVIAQVPAQGRAHLVTSFPVLQSNWPMQVSFPVFVSNTLQRLGLGGLLDEAGLSYRTGQTAAVPVTASRQQVTYTGPATLTAEVTDGQAVLPPLKRVGVYTTEAEVEPPHGRLAVNLLDGTESDLRPADKLQVAAKTVQAKQSAQAVQQPIWPWFAAAALVVMMGEWLFYTLRMRV